MESDAFLCHVFYAVFARVYTTFCLPFTRQSTRLRADLDDSEDDMTIQTSIRVSCFIGSCQI